MNERISLTREDLANVITHFAGLVFFLLASPFLIYRFAAIAEPLQIFGITLFCISLIMVYLSSTLYHVMTTPERKLFFRKVDHICIYFLIAGTHTPLIFLYLNHFYGWMFVAVLWLFVLAGIVYKIFLLGKYKRLSLAIYIAMGWSGVITIPAMWDSMTTEALTLLGVGGLSYMLGTIFFVWEKLPYNHAIWHLFVIGGSIAHFATFFYCL